MFPEITVTELGEKLKSDEKFILLDVRELSELEHAKVTDSRLEVMPMSRLAREGVNALSELSNPRKFLCMFYVITEIAVCRSPCGWLSRDIKM